MGVGGARMLCDHGSVGGAERMSKLLGGHAHTRLTGLQAQSDVFGRLRAPHQCDGCGGHMVREYLANIVQLKGYQIKFCTEG